MSTLKRQGDPAPSITVSAPRLLELQKWLKWVITDPRGVHDAIKNPTPKIHAAERFTPKDLNRYIRRYTEPTPTCFWQIKDSVVMAREDRLDIYAEGYFLRIVEALSEDFPQLERLLGQEAFHTLISDYLKEYPSQYTSLADVGGNLPNFLQGHNVSRNLPYIVDLAALEWAIVKAFYSENVERIALSKIAEISQDAWPNVKFKTHPSFQLLSSEWNVDLFWQCAVDEIEKDSQVRSFAVLCVNGNISVTAVEPVQAECIKLVVAGASLGQISSALDERAQGAAAGAIQGWFSNWIQSGLICDLYLQK